MSNPYQQLHAAVKKANTGKTGKFCQDLTNRWWWEIKDKSGKDKSMRDHLASIKIKELAKLAVKTRPQSFSKFFLKVILHVFSFEHQQKIISRNF